MTFGLRTGAPREVQRVSKTEPGSDAMLSLDLLVVGASLDPVWRDRCRLRVGDREMVVVSRSGLATMKRLAGRAQDLADLAASRAPIAKTKADEIDMSPPVLARRLDEVRALYKLMVYLRRARPLEEDSPLSRSGQCDVTGNDHAR